MPSAPTLAGLSSQTPQGAGLRFLRRCGGAVRNAIAGGIALSGRLRRPPPPGCNPPAPRDPAAPASPGRPRRPRPVAAAPPARPGWLARCLGRNRRQPTLRAHLPFPDDGAPFTPETCPGLSPEACAFFNTPIDQCDPDMLRLLLGALAAQIADSLPPELGTDARALFHNLCGRLGVVAAEPDPAGPPAEAPPSTPVTAEDGPPPVAARDGQPPAPPAPVLPAGEAEAAAPAPIAERQIAPNAARRSRAPLPTTRSRPHGHRSAIRRGLPRVQTLPARRLCYAACAGPP